MIEEDVVNAPLVSNVLEIFSGIIKNELERREFEEIQNLKTEKSENIY